MIEEETEKLQRRRASWGVREQMSNLSSCENTPHECSGRRRKQSQAVEKNKQQKNCDKRVASWWSRCQQPNYRLSQNQSRHRDHHRLIWLREQTVHAPHSWCEPSESHGKISWFKHEAFAFRHCLFACTAHTAADPRSDYVRTTRKSFDGRGASMHKIWKLKFFGSCFSILLY